MTKTSAQFTVTAHTGCENTPDNTMESVLKALESGADIFEIDVHFDQNQYPVLSHNAPTGTEPILDEAFSKLAKTENVFCNLDIKATENLKAVLSCAQKYGVLDKVFYTGITEDFVEAARTETPEISYYLNIKIAPPETHDPEYVASLVNTVRKHGAVGINCHFGNVTEELITAFHENRLLVSLWTVNEKEDMLRIISMKPDNITTRYPSLLKSLCSESERPKSTKKHP